jgi:AcrR family transcriptional regulator
VIEQKTNNQSVYRNISQTDNLSIKIFSMATNLERSTATQQRLTAQARRLFATQGYAATGTEAILEAAGVKRGALYHHFADKSALFEAVCKQICEEAASAIEAALPSHQQLDPKEELVQGSLACLQFMLQPDIRQIMLIDAPTALGWARWQALEKDLGTASLQSGIEAAIATGDLKPACSAELLTTLMNGALNALALRAGAPDAPLSTAQCNQAIHALWDGQFRQKI